MPHPLMRCCFHSLLRYYTLTSRVRQEGARLLAEHGYVKNDFDAYESTASEFLEQAAKEWIAERWQKVTAANLPAVTKLQASSTRRQKKAKNHPKNGKSIRV